MGRNKSHKTEVPLRSKLKKDPGVPRLPTLKQKNIRKEQHAAKRSLSHAGPIHPDPDATMAVEPTLSSLAALAASSSILEAPTVLDPSSSNQRFADPSDTVQTKEQQYRHHIRALHKVIDESDIILLVMDARDPEGCRSRIVEEEVRRRESEGKRLIFVLNKIDLVPRDNAEAWLRYLRHTTPTLPFRSASSAQRSNLSSTTAPALVRLLKAYRPSIAGGGGKATAGHEVKQSVTVGVVGYPNVGKSSLINSLKRSKVCPVASTPGHTQTLQTVHLERGLKIVDSPGVIFDDADTQVDGAGKARATSVGVLLRNVVKVEDINDVVGVVEEILSRTDHEAIRKIYNLPQIGSTTEFLTMLALVSGRLLKGGAPDVLSAAKTVLNDWNHHKIPFFSTPPTIHPSLIPSTTADGEIRAGAEDVGQARIVTEMGKAFSLPGFDFGQGHAGDGEGMDVLEEADRGAFDSDDRMETEGPVEQGEIEMDDAEPLSTASRKRARSPAPSPPPTPSAMSGTGLAPNEDIETRERQPKRLRRSHDIPAYDSPVIADRLAEMNPLNRRALKKAKKKERRAGRTRVPVGASSAEGGMDIDDEGVGMEATFMV